MASNRETQPLTMFLLGTIDSESPLTVLRGHQDVLNIIWTFACEEWWLSQIDFFPDLDLPEAAAADERVVPRCRLPDLTAPARSFLQMGEIDDVDDTLNYFQKPRQRLGGCPAAIVSRNVAFPPPSPSSPSSPPLNVNMLPFDIRNIDSLPGYLRQYWPLVSLCSRRLHESWNRSSSSQGAPLTCYLTVDERPSPPRHSQRRPGLHVEFAGVLPVPSSREDENLSQLSSTSGFFVPGAEHFWGGGLMMRGERIHGGIFMCSTVADTTAIYNCRVRNDRGDVVGPHGALERLRGVLGGPTHVLGANEMVWITDKTPHESLPFHGRSRQYFRLVVGEVTAWFKDHSTENPLYKVPPGVRIIEGDKFELFPKLGHWVTGSESVLARSLKEQELSNWLNDKGLGHLTQVLREGGVRTIEDFKKDFIEKSRECLGRYYLSPELSTVLDKTFPGFGSGWLYYESRVLSELSESQSEEED